MTQPVIVSGVRTAIGKRNKAFKNMHPVQFGSKVIKEALKRAKVSGEEITDVIMGNCLSNVGNMARFAVLEAGLPVSAPGLTIDRQCGSGINSVVLAAQMINSDGGIYVAGGIESMSKEPLQLDSQAYKLLDQIVFLNRDLSPDWIGNPPMGITAENIAEKYGITTEAQHTYALRSQKKMNIAMKEQRFMEQILPIEVTDDEGRISVFQEDEHPRPLITLEQLNNLKPVFKEGGTVTAGSSSGINDGAGALVLMDEEEAVRRGLEPFARIISYAVAGVDPNLMGLGPVPATRMALEKAGLTIDEMDLVELNEAFAVQVLACVNELGIDPEKLNVNGGAIAHGHPIAATGAMLVIKGMYELKRRQGRYALITACIGGGQGIALIIENAKWGSR
ncbi:thiolase family protein [Bhargavaea beijingensis]|uniref:thiolase family protein n=1 Tax=Bhargavaea beijingensis TaxID=426756 RepID=UPI0022251D0B|nr:thiolase family protein [Bhargavaea beijingensis]MCW1927386.1 thiolase family protein [Bhargavaea beijingensis]